MLETEPHDIYVDILGKDCTDEDRITCYELSKGLPVTKADKELIIFVMYITYKNTIINRIAGMLGSVEAYRIWESYYVKSMGNSYNTAVKNNEEAAKSAK